MGEYDWYSRSKLIESLKIEARFNFKFWVAKRGFSGVWSNPDDPKSRIQTIRSNPDDPWANPDDP